MHIWWFRDGRAGHERQARALIEALARLREVTRFERPRLSAGALLGALAGRLHPDVAAPDLILGVGHDTHLSLLAARRARGGRVVVIMRPSLPVRWFDLCIAPRHDGLGGRAKVIETLGPLSPMRPAAECGEAGLVLVGGPSRHYEWNEEALIDQIGHAVAARSEDRWTLATSRRTPASFADRARAALPDTVSLHPVETTEPGWLDDHLPRARACLVTPDSLSMIFDALTAGVPCGVFELAARPGSRVARTVERLVGDGLVGRVGGLAGGDALPSRAPLAEADRVARRIVDRWFL